MSSFEEWILNYWNLQRSEKCKNDVDKRIFRCYTDANPLEMNTFEEEITMKKLIAVLLTLCMLLACTAAMADTLTMGTNASFPPYEYYEDNVIVGIDAEIAAAIAEKLGSSVSSQSGVTFSSMGSNSLDPKFVGAIFNAPVGELCGPVAGTIGAYVFQVKNRDTGSFYTEDDAARYEQQKNQYNSQMLMSVMMDDADVKDNRARFF